MQKCRCFCARQLTTEFRQNQTSWIYGGLDCTALCRGSWMKSFRSDDPPTWRQHSCKLLRPCRTGSGWMRVKRVELRLYGVFKQLKSHWITEVKSSFKRAWSGHDTAPIQNIWTVRATSFHEPELSHSSLQTISHGRGQPWYFLHHCPIYVLK